MLFAVSLLVLFAGIWASDDYECVVIPGKLIQLDAGDGGVVGVNANHDIFRWVDGQWKHIPGKLIHVTHGPAGFWGVNSGNVIYKWHNNQWMSVSGALKMVDAGGAKYLAGVNAQDKIYCLRQSCTISGSSVVSFTPLDGSLKYYTCGKHGCWGVNSGDAIYYRHNVNPNACQGNQWQHIPGSLAMIEVGTDGSVFGVNKAGHVYRRDGITEKTPIGTTWTQLDFCGTFKHVSYDDGYLWLINPNDEIFQCKEKK